MTRDDEPRPSTWIWATIGFVVFCIGLYAFVVHGWSHIGPLLLKISKWF